MIGRTVKPGRYALDMRGELWRWPAPDWVKPVAAVTVRALPRSTGRAGQPLQRTSEASERNTAILAAYDAGEALVSIAQRFGLSDGRISQIAMAAGRPKRPNIAQIKSQGATKPVTPARPIAERIDLASAPSGMDRAAPVADALPPIAAVQAKREIDGQVPCRCGAKGIHGYGMVPRWFGRDCIEAACPLKVAAA